MSCEILCTSLPSIPTCATYSRRLQTVFTASPLTSYSLNSELTSTTPLSYRGHADTIRLSRDERNLAVSAATAIKLIDLNSGREIRNLPTNHTLSIKSICPQRSSIYSWVSGSLDSSWTLWDTRCHPANVLGGHVGGPIKCIDISPNDSLLAVGTDSSLCIFDIRNRQSTRFFSSSTVGVQFNPVQMMLATYGLDRVVRFWCLEQMECISQSDALPTPIRGIAFSGERENPANDYLVAATDTELRMLSWEPCDTLFIRQLDKEYSVLELNFNDDVANLTCYSVDNALIMLNYSIGDIVNPDDDHLPDKFAEFTVEEDEDLLVASDSSISPSPSSSTGSTCSIQNNSSRSSPTTPAIINNNNNKSKMAVATIPRSAPSNIPQRRVGPSTGVSSSSVPQKLNCQNTPTSRTSRAVSASRCQRVNSVDALNTRPRSPTEPAVLNRPNKLPLSEKAKTPVSSSSSASKQTKLPPLPTRKPSPAARIARDVALSGHSNSASNTPMINKTESSELSTLADLFSQCMKGHHSVMRLMEERNQEANRFIKSARSGANLGFDNGLVGGDFVVAKAVIKQITDQKRWDLRLVHSNIVRIKMMLGETKCTEVALDAIEFIANGLKDKFKSFAQAVSGCGVDVAQEQRKEKSEFCIKELKELVKNRDQYYKTMSECDMLRFDSILKDLKDI